MLTSDTPGTLGRSDWADPDQLAFQCRTALPGEAPLSSLIGAEVGPRLEPQHPHTAHPPKAKKSRFKLPPGVPTGPIDDPEWVRIACQEESAGVHESRGLDENNPRILEYLATVPGLANIDYMIYDKKLKKKVKSGKKMSEVDETAWCGCFVNWCLKQAKMYAPSYSLAKAWKNYGTPVEGKDVKVGSIAVIYKEPSEKTKNMTTSGYHVAFYIGGPLDEPVLLGGNQSDSVCRKQFKDHEVDYVWPTDKAPERHKKKKR